MNRSELIATGKRTLCCMIACIYALCGSFGLNVSAEERGGGAAVMGQSDSVGYSAELYDSSNGLPTSEANTVFSASDGFIWIGGYSGLIRYDGTSFERQDSSSGITSVNVVFEDSKGRLWVGIQ